MKLFVLFLAFLRISEQSTIDDNFKLLPELKPYSYKISDKLEADDILQYYLYHVYPRGALEIEYENIYNDVSVEYGNYISPLDTIEKPVKIEFRAFFSFNKLFENSLYSLALTDLDPDYQKCHAIWTNIPIEKSQITFLDEEQNLFKVSFDPRRLKELMPYVGPQPKQLTGIHRYVFLMFRQPYGKLPLQRLKFRERWGSIYQNHGVDDWASFYGLEPLAINYFTSSNEDLF